MNWERVGITVIGHVAKIQSSFCVSCTRTCDNLAEERSHCSVLAEVFGTTLSTKYRLGRSYLVPFGLARRKSTIHDQSSSLCLVHGGHSSVCVTQIKLAELFWSTS